MAPDPYTRSYWRFADEFPDIYANDFAFALWSRLRDEADKAWPSSAPLPYGVKQKALRLLIDAELVMLQPGNRYRIRGMDKHREQRAESARAGADARWSRKPRHSDRTANAMQTHSERNANGMHIPSRAEPSQEEPSQSSALAPSDEMDAIEAYNALTARAPSREVMGWLDRMATEYGEARLVQTMGHVWSQSPELRSFLSTTETRLASTARSRSKQDEAESKRQAAKRERAERERIEAMPPEQRKANMQRLGSMLRQSGLIGDESA